MLSLLYVMQVTEKGETVMTVRMTLVTDVYSHSSDPSVPALRQADSCLPHTHSKHTLLPIHSATALSPLNHMYYAK